jgi:hypothetical protein
MIPHQDTLRLVDDAITHLDQALAALGQIRKEGEQAITVDSIEHELQGLSARLRSLHDEVTAENDHPA